jgi:hypothetical protein
MTGNSAPTILDLPRILSWLGQYLPLNLLPWVIFGLDLIGFLIISIILIHHWRTYGRGMIMFLSAAITYLVGSAVIIWIAFLLLSLYSLK